MSEIENPAPSSDEAPLVEAAAKAMKEVRRAGKSGGPAGYDEMARAALAPALALLAERDEQLRELNDAAKEYRQMVASWFDFSDTDAYDELNAAIVHADRAFNALTSTPGAPPTRD